MSTHKYLQYDDHDKYRTVDDEGHTTHSGKAYYDPEDGHLIQWNNISPVKDMPGYHYDEWWNEREGYGYELHKDHK